MSGSRRAPGEREQSSRVQCVVDWFGPTDFLKMGGSHDGPASPESRLVGGRIQQNAETVARANPFRYVTPDDPPFLIVHGDADRPSRSARAELLEAASKRRVST